MTSWRIAFGIGAAWELIRFSILYAAVVTAVPADSPGIPIILVGWLAAAQLAVVGAEMLLAWRPERDGAIAQVVLIAKTVTLVPAGTAVVVTAKALLNGPAIAWNNLTVLVPTVTWAAVLAADVVVFLFVKRYYRMITTMTAGGAE